MRTGNACEQCVLEMRGMRTTDEHGVCEQCMRTMHAYMDASELCVRGMRTRYAYEVAVKSLQLLFFGFPQPHDYQNQIQTDVGETSKYWILDLFVILHVFYFQ